MVLCAEQGSRYRMVLCDGLGWMALCPCRSHISSLEAPEPPYMINHSKMTHYSHSSYIAHYA